MPTKKSNWTVERGCDMVQAIRFDPLKNNTDERWILLMSDEHADNAHSDLSLIRRHHQEAVERDAPILKFGDTFCAMQGKWDKRADQNQLRDEMRGNNYLDRLMDFHEELYKPFASQIAINGRGNHETSIGNHHQTDLIERITDRLNKHGSPAIAVGFTGFIRLMFKHGEGNYKTYILHFHHGYGGGGEVTRGMIDNSRTRGQYWADVHYSGHIHRRNMDENVVTTVNHAGNLERRTQLFLRGGAYKHEDGANGWHTEKGRSARPAGGWWLKVGCRSAGGIRTWNITAVPA